MLSRLTTLTGWYASASESSDGGLNPTHAPALADQLQVDQVETVQRRVGASEDDQQLLIGQIFDRFGGHGQCM